MRPLLRRQDIARVSVTAVALDLPQVISEESIDRLTAEWSMYENENIPDEWYEQKSDNTKRPLVVNYHPIDHYWRHVLSLKTNSGNMKYILLAKLVKSLLSLSHSNGDIDSETRENETVLPDDRSPLSVASINRLRATNDAVRFYGGGKVQGVSVNYQKNSIILFCIFFIVIRFHFLKDFSKASSKHIQETVLIQIKHE